MRGDGEGRHQIVRVVREPELLGERALVAGRPYEASAEVPEEAVVCFMEARRFEELWDSEPGVVCLLARRLAERLGQAQEALAELERCGLVSLEGRDARVLNETRLRAFAGVRPRNGGPGQ